MSVSLSRRSRLPTAGPVSMKETIAPAPAARRLGNNHTDERSSTGGVREELTASDARTFDNSGGVHASFMCGLDLLYPKSTLGDAQHERGHTGRVRYDPNCCTR